MHGEGRGTRPNPRPLEFLEGPYREHEMTYSILTGEGDEEIGEEVDGAAALSGRGGAMTPADMHTAADALEAEGCDWAHDLETEARPPPTCDGGNEACDYCRRASEAMALVAELIRGAADHLERGEYAAALATAERAASREREWGDSPAAGPVVDAVREAIDAVWTLEATRGLRVTRRDGLSLVYDGEGVWLTDVALECPSARDGQESRRRARLLDEGGRAAGCVAYPELCELPALSSEGERCGYTPTRARAVVAGAISAGLCDAAEARRWWGGAVLP